MRIFNLTDVRTPELEQYGLVHQTFSIGGQLLSPGESVTIEDETAEVALSFLIDVGAIHIGETAPQGYLGTKRACLPEPQLATVEVSEPRPEKTSKSRKN